MVTSNGKRGKGTTLMGGLAEQFQGTGAAYQSTITAEYDQTRETNGYGNGKTYSSTVLCKQLRIQLITS